MSRRKSVQELSQERKCACVYWTMDEVAVIAGLKGVRTQVVQYHSQAVCRLKRHLVAALFGDSTPYIVICHGLVHQLYSPPYRQWVSNNSGFGGSSLWISSRDRFSSSTWSLHGLCKIRGPLRKSHRTISPQIWFGITRCTSNTLKPSYEQMTRGSARAR